MRSDAFRSTGLLRFGAIAQAIVDWRARLIKSIRFATLARRWPVLRGIAHRNGQELFDLMSGFVYSQVLTACVELKIIEAVAETPQRVEDLAVRLQIDPVRLQTLCNGAVALEILTRRADGRFGLGRFGAAVLSTPGLRPMIEHHALLYRDLMDPVALLKGETQTELSQFWPYVAGPDGVPDAETAKAYSDVMSASQTLVSEETLRVLDLSGVRRLMDVGGGDGTFLTHLSKRWPEVELRLFDLPKVAERAVGNLARAGINAEAVGGSFDDGALPVGADAITLVRVLFDHDYHRVETILSLVYEALPPGGLVIISEPMAGGAKPSRAGDAYFGLYTMAMTTGRSRSAPDHASRLQAAGFERPKVLSGTWPFVTTVVTARKPLP
ncbi:MAG: methyltransferase [Pseudomonadota bacterium]